MSVEKSWRNFELVLYPENMNGEKFENGLKKLKKYAWILHDKDEGREVHAHLYGQPNSPMKTSVIANLFGIRENQIEKIKGTWNDAMAYLTHANAPEKHQYDPEEVHANFDWGKDAKRSKSAQNRELEEVIAKITTGEIRQYNITDYVSGDAYVRNERKIKAALNYRMMYVKAHLEELIEMKNIIWIYGETGKGKTTFAKELAKGYKMVYAITSIGKNPFDDYLDEPCIIMDDLRPQDLSFADLLGILDPYNFKHAAARYHNKALQTQLVIVTTTISPELFAQECNGGELVAEDARQLYRRLNSIYEVLSDEIIEYEYDERWNRVVTERIPNLWLQIAQSKKKKRDNSILHSITMSAMEQLEQVTSIAAV
jgi:hypothetical protein